MTSRADTSVSVVIPTLNEEANIGWVLDRVPPDVDEVVLVDGRSTDRTIDVARRARPDLRLVEEPTPGKGAALRSGLLAARCEAVVILDADGSMAPSEIERFIAKLDEGYELVKGSRFMPGGGTADISRLRAFGNLVLVELMNRLFAQRFTELCYGYMALRRDVIRRLQLDADGFEIETQIVAHALRAGLRVAEVPSFEAVRLNGASHLHTFRDGSRVLREMIRARARNFEAPPSPTRAAPAAAAATLETVPATGPGTP